MATLIKIKKPGKTPGYSIQWYDQNGRHRTIYLGGRRYTEETAEEFKRIVERLDRYLWDGTTVMDKKTAVWLATAPAGLVLKLKNAGLITIIESKTCDWLWDSHIKNKTGWKSATRECNLHTRKLFFEKFSPTELIEQITPDRVMEWKNSLLSVHAPASVRGYLSKTKAAFDFAVKRNLLASNPMLDVPIESASQCVNREKFRIITVEEYAKLLEACPTQEWRVIVALARWIGLRGISEVKCFRWRDIDWTRCGVWTWTPKTEHHTGHQKKFVPLFQEVRVELERLRSLNNPTEDDFVIQCVQGKSRSFLYGHFQSISRKAGLGEIDQPFFNMRRTRCNEIRIKYGSEKESEWMGHSQKVMRTHYLDLTMDDFTDIVGK